MYQQLIQLIGIDPIDNPFGFMACVLILMWFLYILFSFLYSFVRGK